MAIGTRVKTKSSYSTSSHITKIERIYTNDLGTTIYVMDNGQFLSRGEFEAY